MSIQEINLQIMIDEYTNWLKQEISFSKVGDFYEITTPYLNCLNDYLQFYVQAEDNKILFSDDGYTLDNLEATGFKMTPAREKHLNQILLQYGVQLEGKDLITTSSLQEFPQKKHLFVQAMLRVDDMFALSQNKVMSYFVDDIQKYFDKKEIYYTENVQFIGISGYSNNFDFLLQRSKRQPERLCRAVNNPTRSNMESILFSWNDIKSVRKPDSQLVVFLNDNNGVPEKTEQSFINYGVHVIKWSEREEDKTLKILTA